MDGLEAGIVVSDVEAATRFYVEGLGFSVMQELRFPQGAVHRLRRGTGQLKLYQPAQAPRPGRHPDHWRELTGFAYATLGVDDAEVALAEAVAAGATVFDPVTAHRPGARYALIADPDGNMWELLEES